MGQSSNVAAASKHHLPGMPTRVHSTGTSRPTQAEGLSTVVPATQVSCLRLRKEIRAVLMFMPSGGFGIWGLQSMHMLAETALLELLCGTPCRR